MRFPVRTGVCIYTCSLECSAFKAAVALQKYDFSGKAKIVWSNA